MQMDEVFACQKLKKLTLVHMQLHVLAVTVALVRQSPSKHCVQYCDGLFCELYCEGQRTNDAGSICLRHFLALDKTCSICALTIVCWLRESTCNAMKLVSLCLLFAFRSSHQPLTP
jgi:hypothetical protein